MAPGKPAVVAQAPEDVLKTFVHLMDALGEILWPIIVAILVWKLFPHLREILDKRPFSVKVGNIEVSVQDATEQFRTQLEDLQKQVVLLKDSASSSAATAPSLEAISTPEPETSARLHPVLLWVDDKPEGNAYEIAQMESTGFDVITSRATAEGMNILRGSRPIAAVISDMGRTESGAYRSEAGLELLREMRKSGFSQPFLIYTGKRGAESAKAKVLSAGGDGATASPVNLMHWLRATLGSPAPLVDRE